MGGFSEDNLLCIDQRGFKTIIQAEAAEFLKPSQLMLNSTVKTIEYSTSGVKVTLTNGKTLSADYALVTFSVGVLQNNDVSFIPALPDWKQEAIQSITMVSFRPARSRFLNNQITGIYASRQLTLRYFYNFRTSFGLIPRCGSIK